jgi:hypothetical protein
MRRARTTRNRACPEANLLSESRLDNPKAVNQQPPAAKVLAAVLDKLSSAQAQIRRGRLAVVRTLTEQGGAPWH